MNLDTLLVESPTVADVDGGASHALARSGWSKLSVVPFVIFHAMPLLVIFTGVTSRAVVIALVTYFVRLVAITAGYHRYFSHRTYRTGRVRQFLLALVGVTAVQRGPLWWAGNHRAHHRYSDTERDPHSATRGFWWSHVGWILSANYAEHERRARSGSGPLPRTALHRSP